MHEIILAPRRVAALRQEGFPRRAGCFVFEPQPPPGPHVIGRATKGAAQGFCGHQPSTASCFRTKRAGPLAITGHTPAALLEALVVR